VVGQRAALVTVPAGVLGTLARLCAAPVAMTSANVSPGPDTPGTRPALSVREVIDYAGVSGADLAVVVDGGVCPSPADTTIVDCSGPNPSLSREGAVDARAIRLALVEAGMPFTDGRRSPASG
jgi:tRNA A37 threonylcarbamoyladenosine synthetase subunit TsaC/SUA5/YrdC